MAHLLISLLLAVSTLQATAKEGHISGGFLFQRYENGKFSGTYFYMQILIGRDEKGHFAFCSLASLGKSFLENDKNAMTLSVIDVTVRNVEESREVDLVGHLKSLSFSLLFPYGDEQKITIENIKEDGKSFKAYGRGTSKTFGKRPQLIDVEWRQVDKIELPNATIIVPQ